MRVPTHLTHQTASFTPQKYTTSESVRANVGMDRARRLHSPGMKKKPGHGPTTFGVPLAELVRRAPQGYRVPYAVKKICSYLEHHGLDQEGIFRVSGSQRVVEKLRARFDAAGDADLDEDGDVMAVAGLLKLLLRELPESAIPEHMTRRFVMIQEENQRNIKEMVIQLKKQLVSMPEEHYDLVKHVIRFLAIVACNESMNKMSPMSLAIVFGPNLFRCGKGFLALKDQGTTNQIVYRFIVDYNSLFKEPGEDPPAVYWERKKHNLVPPRPPPPKLAHREPEPEVVRPTPLPRKSKLTSQGPEIEEPDHSEDSVSSKGRNSHSYNSPSFSDDEMTGRLSPFHLDSDSGFSLVESPVPSARTSEFVDRAIKATVIGHLFGDESSLLNASIDTTIREDHVEPALEVNHSENTSDLNSTPTNIGVRDRMRAFEDSGSNEATPTADNKTRPGKQKPTSAAFDMFESKGIIISQMAGLGGGSSDEGDMERGQRAADFDGTERNTDTLHTFKRPAGPQNRHPPSRLLRLGSADSEEEGMEDQGDIELIPNGHGPEPCSTADIPRSKERRFEGSSDVNHNDSKARIAFLDIRQDVNKGTGQDKSPNVAAKPFVPPLDFSTLHENVGGQGAIPAQKALSVAYQRASLQVDSNEDEDHENDAPSPRSNKVKRKAGTSVDDEELPFSLADQDQYKSHSHGNTDDELTTKMKSQMRKIQGLKKKIRQFEELFEREHGYKPSHAEKAGKPEIKKFLTELSRARKEAKRLKEEAEMGSRSRHGSGASSVGERTDPPDLPPSMAQTLDLILKRLREKRREMHRPEDIELMSHEQVQEEKLAVQKALLHFEGIHGRPKTKAEKDLMRPLYDRYRTIKRLLSRQPMSPRSNLELQPVPEDGPMDIQSKFNDEGFGEPIRVPTAVADVDDYEDEDPPAPLGTVEFAVTRDFSILRNRPLPVDNQGPHSPKARRKLNIQDENKQVSDSNIHELSVPELQDELMKSRNTKKRLRKTLRDFEDSFTMKTGRKVGRDDRIPMQTEYNEYKQLKARLKLLEALLSKHQPSDV